MTNEKLSTIEGKREFYRDIVENWGTDGRDAIAKRWGVSAMSVGQAVGRLRRQGINLPKQNGNDIFSPTFVNEMRELAIGKYGYQRSTPQQYASESKKCTICGKTYYRRGSRSQFEASKTCSRKCAGVLRAGGKVSGTYIEDDDSDLDFVMAYCQSPTCQKPERKYVQGTGVSHDEIGFCSERCKEAFVSGE